MNSLSVGVKSVFSDVNCLSKFDTSLRCFCMTSGGKRKRRKSVSIIQTRIEIELVVNMPRKRVRKAMLNK